MKNHQDIVNAKEALNFQEGQIIADIRSDFTQRRRDLSMHCADLGHVYAKNPFYMGGTDLRLCVFCGAGEPALEKDAT